MVQWTVFLISYWGDQIGQKVKKICDWCVSCLNTMQEQCHNLNILYMHFLIYGCLTVFLFFKTRLSQFHYSIESFFFAASARRHLPTLRALLSGRISCRDWRSESKTLDPWVSTNARCIFTTVAGQWTSLRHIASPPTRTSLCSVGDVADGDLPAAGADAGSGCAAPVEGACAEVQGGADGAESLQPVGHWQMPDRWGLVSHRQATRAAECPERGRGKWAESHSVDAKVLQ